MSALTMAVAASSELLATWDHAPSSAAHGTGRLATWDAVREFVFAGNATFTLRSLKTGARYTYKVTVKKADRERLEQGREQFEGGVGMSPSDVTYFVSLLRGPDNDTDYAYMGVLRKPGVYHWTAASGKVGFDAPAYKALLWMLDAMTRGRDVLGQTLEVWHEGRCGRCGRKLTVPESIAAGLGPECASRAF